ncbi:hypothetical protein F5Y19DRAFT_415789 [Xylariaceae sp. FL1651]|nr:hypothetical protein F5Y19DRAFT_415789 [Xylariaceae sp. FL1651]
MQLTRTILSIALLLTPIVSGNPIPEGDAVTSVEGLFKRATYTCPATNNGQGRDYQEHKYTSNQVTAAVGAAKKILQKKGENWKPGPQDYPHFFGNREQLPFDCGKDKAEYPLDTNGHTWSPGEPVNTLPDRVIFEYSWKKDKVTVKKCGVIRHGPGANFLNCPS